MSYFLGTVVPDPLMGFGSGELGEEYVSPRIHCLDSPQVSVDPCPTGLVTPTHPVECFEFG
jgi:hypothetical protein